jgi:hypothetical protein
MSTYDITEEKANEVRVKLEARHKEKYTEQES